MHQPPCHEGSACPTTPIVTISDFVLLTSPAATGCHGLFVYWVHSFAGVKHGSWWAPEWARNRLPRRMWVFGCFWCLPLGAEALPNGCGSNLSGPQNGWCCSLECKAWQLIIVTGVLVPCFGAWIQWSKGMLCPNKLWIHTLESWSGCFGSAFLPFWSSSRSRSTTTGCP